MAPSKKLAFTVGGQEQDEDSNSWDDGDRHEIRFKRIRTRIPTGHPQLAKRVMQHLDDGESDSNSSEEVQKKEKRDKEKSSKKKSSSKDKESSPKKKKPSSKKKVPESDDELEEPVVKKKSHKKKKPVLQFESETSDDPEPEKVVKHKSHKKKKITVASSSTESEESEKIVVKKASRKKRQDEVKMGRATVVEGGDSSWDEEQRKQERFSRIRKRVPTGHPGLAKKVMASQKALYGDSDSGMEEETEATPPKKKSKESSERKVSSVKREKSSKKKAKEAIHFGEAKKVDSDSEGSWEEEQRKEERFIRIRSRVPTGHPGLAKKLLAARAQMGGDDDGEGE
eukprot:Gregarina_sp_Poly_1__7644@NODE_429_length_8553_cov_130_002239_g350_i0_p3_GENE_NODE_429_length_8553_cov_130_002239_g350_i0NODE_429_length_8553_cov_130_002239_g350_i0_p3_ORF_typecomplete_len340_score91_06DUF4617/PF15395_6/0_62_NODE_429_length_8553_cov_130_002239_g350_i055716590